MKNALRRFAKAMLVFTLISSVAAMLLLIAAQYWPDAAAGVITVGDTETPIAGVFSAGIVSIITAWLAVTFAVIVSVLAILFALVVTVLTLVLTVALLCFPFIISGLVVWLVMRRKQRNSVVSSQPMPPAASA
jgi:hypothetical protein